MPCLGNLSEEDKIEVYLGDGLLGLDLALVDQLVAVHC